MEDSIFLATSKTEYYPVNIQSYVTGSAKTRHNGAFFKFYIIEYL